MKPHVMYIASYDKQGLMESSIRSLDRICNDYYCTVIITNVDRGFVLSSYINNKADVVIETTDYRNHPPSRWHIEPKSDVCLFLDYDICVKSDINQMLDLCKETESLCGVLAYKKNTLKIKESFQACNVEYLENNTTWIDKKPIPTYYNYGVLAVPKLWLKNISKVIDFNITKLNMLANKLNDNELRQHVGQIALATVIKQLNVPVTNLPLRFNYPDNFVELSEEFPEEKENVVFLHCLTKRFPTFKMML